MPAGTDNPWSGPSGRSRGMTLIELLVAMLVVMIMMTFVGTIYIRAMRVRSRVQETTVFAATARGALGLIRRDLTGAFRLAVRTYDFTYASAADHCAGAEFHWEAPQVPGDPASGCRRLTFVGAVDGSRIPEDSMRPYEYGMVSWAVRNGTFFRRVGNIRVAITSASAPAGWQFSPAAGPPVVGEGVKAGEPAFAYGGSPVFTNIGMYRGAPYIRTDTAAGGQLVFKDATRPFIPTTVTVCFAEGVKLPDWARGEFRALGQNHKIEIGIGNYYSLYSKPCPDGKVALGPYVAGSEYFVIVEPLWWSLGEEAEDLVFYPPTGYSVAADKDTDGTWADDEAGEAADGVWTGPVPRYVDVYLTISDPDHPSGRRRFGQRIAIPAGVAP